MNNGQVWADWMGYIEQGGAVMPPLVAGTMVLWFCLGWRAMTLRRGTSLSVEALVQVCSSTPGQQGPRGILGQGAKRMLWALGEGAWQPELAVRQVVYALEDEMARFSVTVTSLVAAAPLLGLLGTVVGMIETFDSLADQALFSQSGGIAGGISQALITTQMGLVVAIPGLIVGRMLARKEASLGEELEVLEHVVLGGEASR